MDYDKNYIETSYTSEELNERFIKDFSKFRRENNLTQTLLSKYWTEAGDGLLFRA